jgi:hypothetical protein
MRVACSNFLKPDICEMTPDPKRNPQCCAYCEYKMDCYNRTYERCNFRINDRFCDHLRNAIKATEEDKFLFAMDALTIYRKPHNAYEPTRKTKATQH